MNSEGCIAVCAPQSAATVSPRLAIRPEGALLLNLWLEITALGVTEDCILTTTYVRDGLGGLDVSIRHGIRILLSVSRLRLGHVKDQKFATRCVRIMI